MTAVNDSVLQSIQEYAGYFLLPEEISILLDMDIAEFNQHLRNPASPVYKAYHKGKLVSKLKIRKNIVTLAYDGSPAAEQLAVKFLSEQNIAETKL